MLVFLQRAPLAPLASQSSHLNNAFFNYLPASLFRFSFFFGKRAFFFHFSLFLWAVFCLYEHSVVELLAGVMREGFAFVSNLTALLFLSVVSTYFVPAYMHAASVLFSWSMELFAFACGQFEPKILDLSVRFIRIFYNEFFLGASKNPLPN